jgi:hypothetical protein
MNALDHVDLDELIRKLQNADANINFISAKVISELADENSRLRQRMMDLEDLLEEDKTIHRYEQVDGVWKQTKGQETKIIQDQAEKISNMEIWEKKYLNHIDELIATNTQYKLRIEELDNERDKVVPQLVKANGLIDNLRIQIAELEKQLAFMEGEYPEPTIAEKMTEFKDLEQACKRIAELEKELQNSALNSLSAMAQADEHYARVQELEKQLKKKNKCTCGFSIGHPLVPKCICDL